MAYNIADLFEHTVDVDPRPDGARSAATTRRTFARARRAGQPARPPPGRRRASSPATTSASTRANSVEWIEALLAVFKIRAVPDQHQLPLRRGRAALPLRQRRPRRPRLPRGVRPPGRRGHRRAPAAAARSSMIDDGTGADAGRPRRRSRFDEALAAGSPDRDFGRALGRRPSYIIYTGGTTGMPKGVMWRHEDIFFALGRRHRLLHQRAGARRVPPRRAGRGRRGPAHLPEHAAAHARRRLRRQR